MRLGAPQSSIGTVLLSTQASGLCSRTMQTIPEPTYSTMIRFAMAS